MSKEQALFWFVHARVGGHPICLAVAAHTELSARRQARRYIGKAAVVVDVSAVQYPHAWKIDLSWTSRDVIKSV